ncbi:MAG: aminotransferase class IV family protein [Paracoccaceae bacterium]
MESRLRDGIEPGLRLIETLLWDGRGFPRLALHLARLYRSAGLLGWPCEGVAAALFGAVSEPARVRLTLDTVGRVEVLTAPLPPTKAVWRVGLASERLASADPWLSVKSTHRPAYDKARAALPSDLDEVIFLNERDEVCDGTITSVFFDRGQGVRTPPLSSGLLPGVLRASLNAREEVLLARDLPDVRLWVGNSLRGLIPAVYTRP